MSSQINISVSVVPWLNSEQFRKVYDYLFSDEIIKKKWAVDTISVWETKCHPSLPTAIEATYVLTCAVIQDVLWTNNNTLIHHLDLQGIYGSAITRFVSLIVEANKECKSSGAEVAKLIGIPSFIVDIRNEWCHSVRPSLSLLRSATQSALKYLKESYWEKEVSSLNSCDKQPLNETNLRNIFHHFIKYHKDTLAKSQVKVIQTKRGSKLHPEYNFLLKGLEKYLKSNRWLFIKVLISDGIFVPIGEDLKELIDDADYVFFDSDYCLDDDSDENMSEENDIAEQSGLIRGFQRMNFPELPKQHEDLWHPVIALLNKYDAVPLFMEKLLKSIGNRTVVGQKIIIAWIDRILTIHSTYAIHVRSPWLKKYFRHKGVALNWSKLLHSAMVNPCKYTLHILPLIMNNADLKKEYAHHIIGLISIKLGLVPSEYQRKNSWKLHNDASDLRKELECKRSKENKMEQDEPNEDIWALFPDDCYKSWAIGSIINAVIDSEDDDEEEEEEEEIFQGSFRKPAEFPSNKNDDDAQDEDEKCTMDDKDLSLSKIILEIKSRDSSMLYQCPTEEMQYSIRD